MAANGTTLVDTLQNIDSLNGGAGNDTLKVTLNGGAVATPSLTSIENVELRVTAAASALDLSAATGVTSVTVAGSNVSSTAAGGTVAGLGDIANLAVKNQKGDVSFDGSTATTLNLTLDTIGTGGATGVHTVVDLGLVAAAKATTLNITANNANADVIATQAGVVTALTVAATGTNELDMVDVATTATKVTVTGAGSVNFDANTGTAFSGVLTEVTVGDGGVTMTGNDTTDNKLVLVTGAGKDTLTFDGSALKSASTGAGNDKLTVKTADVLATTTINMGAGDDSLIFDAVKFAAGATLNGGDGTDTIGFTYANYNTISGYGATDRAKVTGFEVLSITGAALADADSVDLSKITGVTSAKILGVATTKAASIINIGANATVELAGADAANGDLTASLKTDTSADALTLILNRNFTDNNDTTSTALAAATQKVVLADIESLTVKSTGTNTSLPFTPVDGYKADTITNTLSLTGSDKLTDITVTGDQKLVLASTVAMTKLATVDGSANTGGLDFDGSLADMTTPTTSVAMTIKGSATAANTLEGTGHADTIVGGAKNDTITGGKGGDTLTGNGGNDKFVFAAGDSAIGTDTFDTITDFVANTWGNGTEADLSDATKVTGDVLKFSVVGGVDEAKGFKVFVASSAADATTFLANTASADATQASAALDSTTNKLYVDVSGDGVTDFYISLTGVTTITAAAFELV